MRQLIGGLIAIVLGMVAIVIVAPNPNPEAYGYCLLMIIGGFILTARSLSKEWRNDG